MADINFKVSGTGLNATGLAGKVRQFTLLVDEPEALGGKDVAPNPVEYILLGYAGCLNVVVNLIAAEKGIRVHDLRINVEGNINPNRLFGVSEEERAGFKGFTVNVTVDSDASAEEIEELFAEVERRCPVNDTLKNPTPIDLNILRPTNEVSLN
ncbi:MAG: OsmC family protein [Ignavibacteriae bacterium]|nr:OsmC family protein [Ignavibacteriota bacterium]MCB9214898.1 OsmC family protein [Ignavibacteria bacterium]